MDPTALAGFEALWRLAVAMGPLFWPCLFILGLHRGWWVIGMTHKETRDELAIFRGLALDSLDLARRAHDAPLRPDADAGGADAPNGAAPGGGDGRTARRDAR